MTDRQNDSAALDFVREARDRLADARSFDAIAVLVKDAENQLERYRLDDGYAGECEVDASEIRLRAKRRIGQLLSEKQRTPRIENLAPKAEALPSEYREAYESAGLTRGTAKHYQRLARVRAEDFEAKIEARRAEGRPVSAAMFDAVAEQSREEFDDRRALGSVLAKVATLAVIDFEKIVNYSDVRELEGYIRACMDSAASFDAAAGKMRAARGGHRLELVV